MTITIQPLTKQQIGEMITWTYSGPYAIYSLENEPLDEAIAFYGDPANGYFALVNENGELLGFCNFGADARVPGGDYTADALDIGIGMRPDLTGQGSGVRYLSEVLAFAGRHYPATRYRATVAAFNKRAQRLCEKLGFTLSDQFQRPSDDRPFVIMTRLAGNPQ